MSVSRATYMRYLSSCKLQIYNLKSTFFHQFNQWMLPHMESAKTSSDETCERSGDRYLRQKTVE